MTRVHVCSEPGCPQLEPCPIHGRDRRRRTSGWKHRDGDRAKHAREVYAAKRRHRSCQICGSTEKLDAHHQADGSLIVLCNEHHRQFDRHARKR